MSSVINTNIAAIRTHNVYNRNDTQMNAALTRVATGMKINSAKDGASTWAISEKMRERIRANDQANQNVQNDTALLKTAQGGIGNTIDILKTLKERAINAANDSNLNVDRGRIAVEVEQLLKQIDDNAEKVQFNGRKLLDGVGKDNTTSGFTASTDTASGVTEPTAATMAANATGNSAVFSLTGLKDSDGNTADDTTLLTDMGFAAGDKITFSWKADDTADSYEYEVTDTSTVADLASTRGKLAVSWLATTDTIADQNSVATTGTVSGNPTADGLWAVGDKNVKITDFKVAVTDSDGETNSIQDSMKFTGVQQSTGVVASNSVFTLNISDLKDDSNAPATITTNIANLTTDGSNALIANNGNATITWKDGTNNTQTRTISGNLSSKALTDLFDEAGLTLVAGSGSTLQDAAGNDVTDKDGKNVTGASGTIYAVGAAGAIITNVSLSFTNNDSSDNTAMNTAFNGATTSVQTAGDEAAETPDSDDGQSGTSASLVFHVGGESGFAMTANISSMKVDALFSGYNSGTFAALFTDQETADTAIGLIDTALNTALNEQTKLGAYESRLGYTSDNLTTMNENLEAADSVMRDSDVAKEMTQYMKYSVLAQASQYMLAQASQNAFSVLNLLQA